MSQIMRTVKLKSPFAADGDYIREYELAEGGVEPSTMHPFECRWFQEREALFQPQGSRFYRQDELPTKNQYIMAQQCLDDAMGTPDKLRDWVLAGAELYGNCEPQTDSGNPALMWYRRNETLLHAACQVLNEDNGTWTPTIHPVEGTPWAAIMHYNFEEWANLFSERKNRVELWAT